MLGSAFFASERIWIQYEFELLLYLGILITQYYWLLAGILFWGITRAKRTMGDDYSGICKRGPTHEALRWKINPEILKDLFLKLDEFKIQNSKLKNVNVYE